MNGPESRSDPEAIADAILAGRAVDWPSAGTESNPHDARIIDELKALNDIAAAYRRLPIDDFERKSTAELRGDEGPVATFGSLRLLARIGTGAFGDVFRAWDTRLEREVALKLLRTGRPTHHTEQTMVTVGDPATVLDEARRLARVNHPNVVTIYGADHHEGQVGLWMELIDGVTLDALIREQGSLPVLEVIALGAELSGAVAAVHDQRLIHGDITPKNVMRERTGRVVLMDFGAGHDQDGAGDRRCIAGTPVCMAPETLAGAPATVRSDLYSLGVVLFFLSTGTFPVPGSSVRELVTAHAQKGERSVDPVLHASAPEFFVVLERLLTSDPAERPENARVLQGALNGLLAAQANGSRLAASGLRQADQRPLSRRLVPVLVAALLLGASADQTIRVSPLQDPPRMLVVDVRDASPDSNRLPAYFAPGLSAEIVQDLATIPDLDVSLRSASDTADAVLRVTVSTSGDLVLATTELERAGRVVWHRQFARSTIDSRLLRGDVSGALERLLALDRRVPSAAPPSSRVAYEAFLRGLAAMEKRTKPALLEARDAFTEATLADPEFATGYAALANANSLLGAFGFVPRREAIHRARAAAESALALAPDSSDAHTAMAFVLMETRQVDEALDAYRYALELNPHNVLAHHWYGLSVLDREPLTGVAHLERAYSLAPHSPTISTDLGVAYVRTGRLDLAIPHLTRIAKTFPSSVEAHNQLAMALVNAGRFEEAVETLERTTQTWRDNVSALSLLGYSYGSLGRRADARRVLDVLQRLSKQAYVPPGVFVTVLAGLGDHAEALRIIEQHATPEWLTFLQTDTKLAGLRADARFHAVLEQIGN